jgi:hypothetical protein
VGVVKYFNTAGPCVPELHYMVPPEPRLPEARRLIARGQYFVVHAPRQSGKTTTLLALTRDLRAEGERVALYISCGSAAAVGDDYAAAEQQVLSAIREEAVGEALAPELQPPDPWPDAPPGRRLYTGLSRWAAQCPRPIVLFLDEIDALSGASLIGTTSPHPVVTRPGWAPPARSTSRSPRCASRNSPPSGARTRTS